MIETKKIDAEVMGRAVYQDPQFHMPEYPRHSSSFVQIDHQQDGLLFDGAPEKQLFRGSAAKILLPKLLPLLDGSKSILEIMEELKQFPSKAIYDALALMYTRGLLQEGNSSAESDEPLYRFFERHVDQTRANRSVEQAMENLAKLHVMVQGEDEVVVQALADDLAACGVTVSDSRLEDLRVDSLLIGISSSLAKADAWKEVAKSCFDRRARFLLVTVDYPTLFIGTFHEKDETICFECFLEQVERLKKYEVGGSFPNDHLRRAAAGIVSSEVTMMFSRIGASLLVQNGVKVVNLQSLETEYVRFSNVPYCRGCDAKHDENMEPVFTLANQFESFVAFPSRKYINPKDHQNHYKPSNLSLTKKSKEYPSLPKRKLKPNELLPNLDEPQRDASKLDQLTKILLYSVGVKQSNAARPGGVKRWAPTGGNLGSTSMYFVNEGLDELPKTCYFYQCFTHSLAQLSDKLNVAAWNEAIPNAEQIRSSFSEFWGWLVLTGSYERVSQKYREFAYRICHLDAGVALTQSIMVGNALGLTLRAVDRADQVIENLLELPEALEIVMCVMAIGRMGVK